MKRRASDSSVLSLRNLPPHGGGTRLVILAGQASRIFTIREIIDHSFPGVPIEESFQDRAVAWSLGRYVGVLESGPGHGPLLINVLPSEIAIRCVSLDLPHSAAFPGFDSIRLVDASIILSRRDEENQKMRPVLGKHMNLPNLNFQIAEFTTDFAPADGNQHLDVFEISEWDGERHESLLGRIPLPAHTRKFGILFESMRA